MGKNLCFVYLCNNCYSHIAITKTKQPWRQTTSTDNNVIERFWPELNSRVNYPIKRAFISIRETFDYDLSDPVMKFSVSRVPGPSGCIPIENMQSTKRTIQVFEPLIPTVSEAVRMYEEGGGNLTRDAEFGYDPLVLVEHAYEGNICLAQTNQAVGNYFPISYTVTISYTVIIKKQRTQ